MLPLTGEEVKAHEAFLPDTEPRLVPAVRGIRVYISIAARKRWTIAFDKETPTMTSPFTPQIGAVLSADVAVPDHDREVRFYSRVLSTGDVPLWREADLMNNLGIPIIGLGARTPEYTELPLQWMPHIQVADVGRSVERATALGGRVLLHPADDEGRSLWAVLLDPAGAAFGIIPVPPADAIPPVAAGGTDSPVGHIAWLDLTVPDADGVRDFYREVVGWSAEAVAMSEGEERYADYNMLGADGSAVAGVCHARGVNAELPPVWMLYLPVGDLAESLRRVQDEGGEVIRTTRGRSGEPVYALVRDPVGAHFALSPG
jgi:uncharacterized protein